MRVRALASLSGWFVFLLFAGRDSDRTPVSAAAPADANLLNGVGVFKSRRLGRKPGQIISALIHSACPALHKVKAGETREPLGGHQSRRQI